MTLISENKFRTYR